MYMLTILFSLQIFKVLFNWKLIWVLIFI